MPLSQDELAQLRTVVAGTVGLPLNAPADRLECGKRVAARVLALLAPIVTLDKAEPKPAPKGPSGWPEHSSPVPEFSPALPVPTEKGPEQSAPAPEAKG